MGNLYKIIVVGGITSFKHEHAQNKFWDFADYNFLMEFLILPSSGQLKPTPLIHFYYTLEHLTRNTEPQRKLRDRQIPLQNGTTAALRHFKTDFKID